MRRALRPLWLACRRLVLGAWPSRRLAAPRREEIRHILIVRLDRLGDVVMTAALLPPLRRLYPEAAIDIRVREPFVPLFEQHPDIRRAFSGTVAGAAGRGTYDLVIDPLLDYPLGPAREAAAVGGRWTLGFDVAGRGIFFTLPVAPPHADEPFLASLARLLRPLGFDGAVAPPRLVAGRAEREAVRDRVGEGRFAVIHPGAFYASQRWPSASFAGVADALLARDIGVVLVGADGERPLLQEIEGMMRQADRVHCICGEPLRMMMAAMAEASVVVCNNSGPLHLAGAMGAATVSTMGPTNPVVWWPVGDRQAVLEAPDCDHCERGDCPRGCLARIAMEPVLQAVWRLLERDDSEHVD